MCTTQSIQSDIKCLCTSSKKDISTYNCVTSHFHVRFCFETDASDRFNGYSSINNNTSISQIIQHWLMNNRTFSTDDMMPGFR